MAIGVKVIAIMAIDQGGTTGVARGQFDKGMDVGMAEAVASAWGLESWDVEGDSRSQAWEIAGEFIDWAGDLKKAGVNPLDITLVHEDFQLRTQNVDLSPVRVWSGVDALLVPRWAGVKGEFTVGYALGCQVRCQTPADAKRVATGVRLREWGLWERGVSAHRRDAMSHLALRLLKEMGGLMSSG